MMPELTLCDGDACSGCRVAALGALRRARPPRLLSPLTVLYGPDQGSEPADGNVLVVGDCALAKTQHGSTHPRLPARFGGRAQARCWRSAVLCQRCQDSAREALRELPPDMLADLRVTAAGDTVYSGPEVNAGRRQRALIVGDCSSLLCPRRARTRAWRGNGPRRGRDLSTGLPGGGGDDTEGFEGVVGLRVRHLEVRRA